MPQLGAWVLIKLLSDRGEHLYEEGDFYSSEPRGNLNKMRGQ